MSQLAPCPACKRHIVTTETACPFCAATLSDSFRGQPPARRPPGRLSRAAMLAAGAALLGAEACSDDVVTVPIYGAPADAAIDSGTTDSVVALYGAAPAPLESAPAAEPPTTPAKS
jgi:hypothetical protein